jgi:hypothetical protein
VRKDVGAARRRLFDGRANLVVRKLIHPDRIGRRNDASRDEDLDLVRAAPEFFARREPNGVGAVDNLRKPEALAAARVVAGSHVPVSTGLRERFAAEEDARPNDQAFVDRASEAGIGARGVANRRKAAQQRGFEQRPRSVRPQYRVRGVDLADRTARGVGVKVRVDQAGHHGSAADVDAPGMRDLERLRRNLDDLAVANEDVAVRKRRFDAVEDAAVR